MAFFFELADVNEKTQSPVTFMARMRTRKSKGAMPLLKLGRQTDC